MTFSALLSLAVLRDDFAQLNKAGLRKFLRAMQRKDGSFASHPGSGEADLRITYCAFVICHILDAWDCIDSVKAEDFILSCQSYEGGFGQCPHQESHGGTTFCAVASLSLSPSFSARSVTGDRALVERKKKWDVRQRSRTVRWLIHRQLGGFQGRTNKLEDACYSFWCGGALKVLEADEFVDIQANAEFLHECQARFGGIAKNPDERPDPFHNYMSLASLSIYPPPLPTGVESSAASETAPTELFRTKPLKVALSATVETADWALKHLRPGETLPS